MKTSRHRPSGWALALLLLLGGWLAACSSGPLSAPTAIPQPATATAGPSVSIEPSAAPQENTMILTDLRLDRTTKEQGLSYELLSTSEPADGTAVTVPLSMTARFDFRNTGSVTWPAGAGLEWAFGSHGPGDDSFFPFGAEVAPGATGSVTVTLRLGQSYSLPHVFAHYYLAVGKGGLRFGDVNWLQLLVTNPAPVERLILRAAPVDANPGQTTTLPVNSIPVDARLLDLGFSYAVTRIEPVTGTKITLDDTGVITVPVSITLTNNGLVTWEPQWGIERKYGHAGTTFRDFGDRIKPGQSVTLPIEIVLGADWHWTYVDTHYVFAFGYGHAFMGPPIRVVLDIENPNSGADDSLAP